MKHLLRFTIFVIPIVFLASCNKEDDTPPPTPTETISDKNWVLTAWTADPPYQSNGTFISDVYNYFSQQGLQCILDDVYYFRADGTYVLEEGATKCDPTNPTIFESGTWLFNSDGRALVMNSHSVTQRGNATTSWEIVQLTPTVLEVTFVDYFAVTGEDGQDSFFPRSTSQTFSAQ